MAASMVCQYPGCTETASLERCNNKDGRLVCALHRTLRNGSYSCVMCDEAHAKAEAEERRTEAVRRRQAQEAEALRRKQAADQEVYGFLRFGTIAAGVVGIVMLIVGYKLFQPILQIGLLLSGLLLISAAIASWMLSEGHRKGPLRELGLGWRAMVWVVGILGAVIGIPVLISVGIAAFLIGSGVKQAADDFSENQKIDKVIGRVDQYNRDHGR